MNVAQQFMNQLQEGKTTEAIKTIKEALHERSAEKIQEEKQDILESYGFVVKEKKYDMKEEDDDMDDEDEKDKKDMDSEEEED